LKLYVISHPSLGKGQRVVKGGFFMWGTISAFVVYLGAMVVIGALYVKQTGSVSDFFLGGRRLGPFTAAISAEASDMSSWLLMGLPGVAYLFGIQEALWTAVGLAVGTYLNWLLVARRLRKYTFHAGDAITIPEFLKNRYKDSSHVLPVISAIFILIFFGIYTASGFVAVGKLFSSVFGLPYILSVLIGVLVILAYTLLGGFLAVCSTDVVQGLLMFFALVVAPIGATLALGGPGVVAERIAAVGETYMNPFVDPSGKPLSLLVLLSTLSWGLGYFGMPHILVRFMAVRSDKDMVISRRVAMVWVIIAMGAAILVGLVGRVYVQPVLEGASSETVFIKMISGLFPSFIAGIFLCAILAATMSTADSQLLVTASAIAKDFYQPLLRKNASEKEIVLVSRLTILIVALLAFFMALNPNSSIFRLVSYAWAGFGATFGPIMLFSLFWKRTTRNGALAGLIVGGLTTIIWKQLSGGIFDLYELLPGFIIGSLAILVASLLDNPPSKEIEQEFEFVHSTK